MRVRAPSVRSLRTRGHCRARLFPRADRAAVSGTSLSLALTSSCSLKLFGRSYWRIFRRSFLYSHCLRFGFLDPALGNVLPLVNPALHADDAVRRMSLGSAIVNVGAQGLQRQPALQVPFLAGDFRAVQASRHANLDSLAAEPQRGFDGYAHSKE